MLDRWSHVKNKDREKTQGLFSCGNSILQVHGCIHKENIVVSINPSCMHNFINIQLVNRLQVPTNNVQDTQVVSEMLKFLNISSSVWINMCCIQIFMLQIWMKWILFWDILGSNQWVPLILMCKRSFWSCGTRKIKSHCRMCLLVRSYIAHGS